MNRRLVFFTLLLMIGGLGGLIAQTAQAVQTDDAPESLGLRNNPYYLESVRLNVLAQSSYEEGDYDASSAYAEESLHYAYLSDEYVAIQAMAAAESRLDPDIARRYPDEYAQASAEYEQGVDAMDAEDWYEAINAANRAYAALDGKVLPARYTVRDWSLSKDCFWNIAAKPFVYGDPRQWRLLYNANRSKLADPDDPNVIEPGVVLEIPPIKEEFRQGVWDERVTYDPLR